MRSPARINIGLLAAELAEWGGGCDLLRLIAAGFAGVDVRVTLLIARMTAASRLRMRLGAYKRAAFSIGQLKRPSLHGVERVDTVSLVETVRSSGCNIDVVEFADSASGLAGVVADYGIDVLLPCMTPPPVEFPGNWIGYIPDVQHKYLPEYFSTSELSNRDRRFQQSLYRARTLIVNSRAAKADLKSYYDTADCEIVVLPFTPLPNPAWLVGDTQSLQAKYALPEKYFLISNQFWQHKDHATAFKALALLGADDVQMICTGSTHDYRAPNYLATLERLIADLQIKQRVRFLGHIEKSEQMAIMRGAVAVVQPTLFEGGPGGGSVYDAVGIGTPAIVSDIPVNQEISEDEVEFFHVGSASHLAEKLKRALESPRVRPEAHVLLERARVRRERLGEALMQAVDHQLATERLVIAR